MMTMGISQPLGTSHRPNYKAIKLAKHQEILRFSLCFK